MQKISILSDELISQIAAGEVVERPASAVKELLENSIDAGAEHVSIEIEEGGMKKIRVVDDGIGMSAEDAVMAFKRHATSKISSIEELFSIRSMGFRGEALASIASIARVILKSKSEDSRIGTLVEIDGGKNIRNEEIACPKGSDITVFGLFEHTPVRKKYMKQERTEYGHIFETISMAALAHPEIGFKFKNGVEIIFDLSAGQSLKERIASLYGEATVKALLPLNYHQSNLLLSGFVGKPELSRSSKKYQFLFVNGRAIEDRSVSHAVREAFHSLLMHEKFPWFLINIEIDPAMVDVNVHPRKLEVKFLNQQEVYRAVMGTVHHALNAGMLAPILEREGEKSAVSEVPVSVFQNSSEDTFVDRGIEDISLLPTSLMENVIFQEIGADRVQQKLISEKKLSLRPVAQIANSYIVAEGEDGLVLIDQHAAHERVLYEKLMVGLGEVLKNTQALLVPLELNLGVDGARVLRGNMNHFLESGFEIEEFGGNTFLLRSVPFSNSKVNPEKLINDIIADLEKDHVKSAREKILTYTACRSAIKFGDPITMLEMQALLNEMEGTPNCSHCPHGRPSMITFTFDKLESLFKRKNF